MFYIESNPWQKISYIYLKLSQNYGSTNFQSKIKKKYKILYLSIYYHREAFL